MTPNEMRIAIAESVGWKYHYSVDGYAFNKGHPLCADGMYPLPPDYPNDLNAMHEATKDFDMWATVKFSDHLKRIIQDENCIASAVDARYLTVNATAFQRAKAYLCMKGLWKE